MQTEEAMRKQNGEDKNRMGLAVTHLVVDIVQKWGLRQSLKGSAFVAAAVFGYMHGRFDVTDDVLLKIATGAGAVVLFAFEMVMSFVNQHIAPKAQPVK